MDTRQWSPDLLKQSLIDGLPNGEPFIYCELNTRLLMRLRAYSDRFHVLATNSCQIAPVGLMQICSLPSWQWLDVSFNI